MNTKEKPALRASQETRRLLKIIAALANESMQETLARLVRDEYERVKKQETTGKENTN